MRRSLAIPLSYIKLCWHLDTDPAYDGRAQNPTPVRTTDPIESLFAMRDCERMGPRDLALS
jgi:hypothetical protein